MTEPTHYPLAWPPGRPRTKERRYGHFGKKADSGHGWQRKSDVTVHQALARIQAEARAFTRPRQSWRIHPEYIVVSTNLRVRKSDSLPASDQRKPEDPGAACYFEFEDTPVCIACDTYTDVAQNIAAIAACLEAIRALERHGSGMVEAAFRGFEALPHIAAPEPWYVVLDLPDDAPHDLVELQYRKLRSSYHPDHNGDAKQFDRLQKAWEQYEASR